MAAGDRNTGIAAEFVGGEVGQRGRHAADVDGVAAGGHDAVHQRTGQFRSRQAAVATDRDGRLALLERQRAEGLADLSDDIGGQAFIDDAADVVGFENFGR